MASCEWQDFQQIKPEIQSYYILMHKDGGQVASNIIKLASTFEMFKGTGHTWLLSKTSFLIGVSQNMLNITNLWKFEVNLSWSLQDNNQRKNTLVAKVVGSRCSAEVSNSMQIFLREITSFSKTTLLQRDPFLTMFYTINSSPLLIIILGNCH